MPLCSGQTFGVPLLQGPHSTLLVPVVALPERPASADRLADAAAGEGWAKVILHGEASHGVQLGKGCLRQFLKVHDDRNHSVPRGIGVLGCLLLVQIGTSDIATLVSVVHAINPAALANRGVNDGIAHWLFLGLEYSDFARKSSPILKTRVRLAADATRQGWLGGGDEATTKASNGWLGRIGTRMAEKHGVPVLLGILEGTVKLDVWVGVVHVNLC